MSGFSLPILAVVLLMWAAAGKVRHLVARQALLLLASYVFYGNWGVSFLAILVASSLLNFALGALLRRRLSLAVLWLGVSLNLLLLAFFKYLPPLLQLEGPGSWQFDLARDIVMPVGISFWTFQGLSYLIDIYLEEETDPSLLEFCLYMAFWPTVLSGPICRLPKMLPQFRKERVFSADDLSVGALWVVQGLFMKMYLAQLLGTGWTWGAGVSAGFDQVTSGWGGIDVWLLGIGFGFLLFFDFAGYSLIAMGVARCFGFRVAENFDRPFLSTTPAKFWARWHMSLSFWIRDYVFTPLTFVSRYRWWPYAALVISMTLFGLWHGAKWTFVAFGVYHGLLLVLHRLGQRAKLRLPIAVPVYIRTFLAWATTFLLVSLGFVLFRANDLTQAMTMLQSVVSPAAYRRLVMPRSFYLLSIAVPLAYFAVSAGHALLLAWRVRYTAAISQQRATQAVWQPLSSSVPLMVGALVDFFTARLWWWLAPVVISVTVLAGVAIYTQSQSRVLSVTPFIYTLF